jgi:hypothetical protein
LWGAAEALRERIHAPVHPAEKPRYDRTKAAIETRLGEAAFATAWSEGRTMSLAQAVGEALTTS